MHGFVERFLTVSVFGGSVIDWVIGISEGFEMFLEEFFGGSPGIFVKPLKLGRNSLNQFVNFALFSKSCQIFLFKVILKAIKCRFKIVSNFGFFF